MELENCESRPEFWGGWQNRSFQTKTAHVFRGEEYALFRIKAAFTGIHR